MNSLLQEQIDELLTKSDDRAMREFESALRIGAATLCGAAGAVTATTVVCDVADEHVETFASLAADIADEYGLAASMKRQPGSCAVRFALPEPIRPVASAKSRKPWLSRLLRW